MYIHMYIHRLRNVGMRWEWEDMRIEFKGIECEEHVGVMMEWGIY